MDIFSGLFSSSSSSVTLSGFLISIVCALLIGALTAFVFTKDSMTSKSFALTLAILPAITAVIIMMVSGNIGAGVAAAGTFSLVRFRSAPGTAKEIGAIFLAMAAGLACGMGYPLFAVIFTVIVCAVVFFYSAIGFGDNNRYGMKKTLKITIPEDLEFEGMFNDLFDKYTKDHSLIGIKTTNMGSMNKLTYRITLKTPGTEKAFIDELRCRNGNLEISMNLQTPETTEL